MLYPLSRDNFDSVLLGPSVGKFCMDLAIKKAKEMGLGMVVAKGMTFLERKSNTLIFRVCGRTRDFPNMQ